jgi:hypothetical protein
MSRSSPEGYVGGHHLSLLVHLEAPEWRGLQQSGSFPARDQGEYQGGAWKVPPSETVPEH